MSVSHGTANLTSSGEPNCTLIENVRIANNLCKVPDCKKVRARPKSLGYCFTHRSRWWRTGTTATDRVIAARGTANSKCPSYHKTRWRNKQRLLFDYLNLSPCADCGEADAIVLEFDHVRGIKRNNISRLIANGSAWTTVEAEIKNAMWSALIAIGGVQQNSSTPTK